MSSSSMEYDIEVLMFALCNFWVYAYFRILLLLDMFYHETYRIANDTSFGLKFTIIFMHSSLVKSKENDALYQMSQMDRINLLESMKLRALF